MIFYVYLGFDQQIRESKERADETLKKIPFVKKKAGEAENKTFDAEDALRGATQDAADARDIAREAKRLAEQASGVSNKNYIMICEFLNLCLSSYSIFLT